MSFPMLVFIGFSFGVALGFCVQRAGLCFAHGLGEIYIGKGKRITRLFLIIFTITSIGFLISGYFSPTLGLKPIGELRGYGLYNLLSGMLFGAGIALCGGCILGTLRQLGEGNLTFLIVFVSFIPGLALVVYGLDPILKPTYHAQKTLLPGMLHLSAPLITVSLVAASLIGLRLLRRRRSACHS